MKNLESKYIIELKELSFSYPDGTCALDGVSLKVPRGAKVALLGPNGAGKSTLFLHFNGILKPANGKVVYNGQEVRYDRKSLETLRKNVGIVFQDPDTQLFSASVYQEISFGPLNLGISTEKVREMVDRAMRDTGIVELKDKPTQFLSYGQKKRVAIADVLAMDPEVIICDEPNVWLDPKRSKQLEQLFNEIIDKGKTIVISTHDVDLAYAWADHIIVLESGRIISEGKPEKIFADEILLKKANLEKPWVFEVAQALFNKGCHFKGQSLPRSKKDLLQLINNLNYEGTGNCDDPCFIGDKGRNRDNIVVSGQGK